jgi:predicted transcriptional regulator
MVKARRNVLHIKVGEPIGVSLARARDAMETLERGRRPEAYFGIGFAELPQLLSVFTPRRWELIEFLSRHGPMTIAELARALQRDYKNVHGDVAALSEWLAVERDETGRVFVPWDEIDVRLPLQHKTA